MNSSQKHIILEDLGGPIEVLIKNSKRARNIGIRINHNRPELIIPYGKDKKAFKFLFSKEKWIRSKIKDVSIPKNKVRILGKEYNIEYRSSLRKWASFDGDFLIIEAPLSKYDNILIDFLQKKLIEEIELILDELQPIANIKAKGIKIMDNKSRWGSCSHKNILSFHWRLIFTIPEVLRYIVIHELCHIKEMNHSSKFWSLVEELDPHYKKHKKWLKDNSAIIHSYLPEIRH